VLLLASITGSLTDFITTLIGNHGVEAVFGLTALAAILPTGGELVMLYAGALAAGAFPNDLEALAEAARATGATVSGIFVPPAFAADGIAAKARSETARLWIRIEER